MDYGCAVVTGAASGIGRALAVRLAEDGTRLVLADLRAEPLTAVADELTATAVPTDVSDLAAVEALAAAAPDADLICLNAGIVGELGAPWDIPAADWDAVFAVNVGGVLNGLRAFVPSRRADCRRSATHVGITGRAAIRTWCCRSSGAARPATARRPAPRPAAGARWSVTPPTGEW